MTTPLDATRRRPRSPRGKRSRGTSEPEGTGPVGPGRRPVFGGWGCVRGRGESTLGQGGGRRTGRTGTPGVGEGSRERTGSGLPVVGPGRRRGWGWGGRTNTSGVPAPPRSPVPLPPTGSSCGVTHAPVRLPAPHTDTGGLPLAGNRRGGPPWGLPGSPPHTSGSRVSVSEGRREDRGKGDGTSDPGVMNRCCEHGHGVTRRIWVGPRWSRETSVP